MSGNWTDFLQRALSIIFAGIGTWLAVKTFYEKRHQETLDRYAQAKEKSYAAERDFAHLSRNQEQMKEALKLLDEELREMREDSRELKGMLMTAFGHAGETISGIFAHRKEKQ